MTLAPTSPTATRSTHTAARRLGLVALLLGASLGAAQAHQLWLEPAGAQVRLHFGEYHDNLRETSPGALDKFTEAPALEARQGAQSRTLHGERGRDAFVYPAAPQADSLLAQARYPVIDRSRQQLPALLWKPAARWVPTLAQAVAPSAPLDLVPTGTPGQFRVVLHGQPLAQAKVELVAPSGWMREATSGTDGTVRFALPWKGLYVAEVKHLEKAGGEQQGQPYGEVSHLMSLSFVQTEGLASPPLPTAP